MKLWHITLFGCLLGGCGSPELAASGPTPPGEETRLLASVEFDNHNDQTIDLKARFAYDSQGRLSLAAYFLPGSEVIELKPQDSTLASMGPVEESDPSLVVLSRDAENRPVGLGLDENGDGSLEARIQVQRDSEGLPAEQSYDDDLDGKPDRVLRFRFARKFARDFYRPGDRP